MVPEGAEGAVMSPEASAPDANEAALEKFPWVAMTLSGDLPGWTIPTGYKHAGPGLDPKQLQAMGLGFYRPSTDETTELAIFNPNAIEEADLKRLDAAGELSKALPPVTALQSAISGSQGSPEASAAPAEGNQAPVAPAMVPVIPKNAAVDQKTAQARVSNITPTVPSERTIPGGGTILNSLIKRAV